MIGNPKLMKQKPRKFTGSEKRAFSGIAKE